MANLLTYTESFSWENFETYNGSSIEELSEAIDNAMELGDAIYITPELFDTTHSWGKLFEFLRNSNYDHDTFKQTFPWVSQSHFTAFMGISFILQTTTPNKAQTIQDLDSEFNGQHNCLFGFNIPCPMYLIYNTPTWEQFHRQVVSAFSYIERCTEYKYFIKFFRPGLTISPNQINTLINKGKTNSFFVRVDTPKIANEQLHIHFADGNNSALNIDGTWKHKSCPLPTEVKIFLSEWGFLLPEIAYAE